MGPLGSIIAGMAVAIAGVAFGKRLQRLRDRANAADRPVSAPTKAPTLDAQVDPKTGSYRTLP